MILLSALAGIYLALLTLMWLALLSGAGRWGEGWKLVQGEAPSAPFPRLSICVPARDEAHNIGACVRAALATRWPADQLELIVVDDRSSDGTGDLARSAAAGDPRCRVILGSDPQPGWAGKPWAVSRATEVATGELLLFIDADVTLHPDAASAMAAKLMAEKLDLLSIFGSWELVGFWERALIPAVGWFIRGAVDLSRVNDPARPEAFANGQCILARREAYDRLDGHGAVRDQVLDDVRLAEAFKRGGARIGLYFAPWAFRVRLYRSLREIVDGYSKNLFEGMGRDRRLGVGAILLIQGGTVLPVMAFLTALVGKLRVGVPGWGWTGWLGALVAIQILFRVRVERADGRSGLVAWAHPLANAILVMILARSMRRRPARWKGRSFDQGRADPS